MSWPYRQPDHWLAHDDALTPTVNGVAVVLTDSFSARPAQELARYAYEVGARRVVFLPLAASPEAIAGVQAAGVPDGLP
jgi:hypothetical protein